MRQEELFLTLGLLLRLQVKRIQHGKNQLNIMENYEAETIALIRSVSWRFRFMTKSKIRQFYRRWSEECYYAGWMGPTLSDALAFVKWYKLHA
jgi:hypothetical protein